MFPVADHGIVGFDSGLWKRVFVPTVSGRLSPPLHAVTFRWVQRVPAPRSARAAAPTQTGEAPRSIAIGRKGTRTVKALVYNNSAFGLIALEAEAIGVPAWKQGIDFPNPDYAALARACGGAGFHAEKPGEFRDAIDQALKADGPAIVDCVISADELPNVPHIELEKIGNYAKPKVKEAILAVTGG
jgi:hypothetical protein